MPTWLTIQQAGEYLKVTVSTIYRWCDEGRLKYYELETGGGRRFKQEDLDEFVHRSPFVAHVIVKALTRDDEEKLFAAVVRLQPTREWELRAHAPLWMTSKRPPVFAAGATGPPRASNELRIRGWVVAAAQAEGIMLTLNNVQVIIEPTEH